MNTAKAASRRPSRAREGSLERLRSAVATLTEVLELSPDAFAVVCEEAVRAVPGAAMASFATDDGTVIATDERAATRHPAANGHDCLTAPLTVDETTAGTLAVYTMDEDGFPDDAAAVLELYAAIVRFGLRARRHHEGTLMLAEQLKQALKSRAVIEQAKGILMAVHRIDADEAMRRLVERSQHENVKLREVAARFVREVT
ncbi:ANTAR domain-containing protein [Amycolatopsis sp. NBC_00345]|uniref:ANTAR domain-containing protein n=1 Tax=Amycolatopsis sp. NBC_00345 TaxID=2975955 RepID=UPI002E26499D